MAAPAVFTVGTGASGCEQGTGGAAQPKGTEAGDAAHGAEFSGLTRGRCVMPAERHMRYSGGGRRVLLASAAVVAAGIVVMRLQGHRSTARGRRTLRLRRPDHAATAGP